MRHAAFLLVLTCAAFAQFEGTEGRMAACMQDCCAARGGSWDGALQDCTVDGAGLNAYQACENGCLEAAGREVGSSGTGMNPCCAPALIFAALAAMAAIQTGHQR